MKMNWFINFIIKMSIYKYVFINLIWLVHGISHTNQKNHAVVAPFFFLCQYHSQTNQPGLMEEEVMLSVHIKGNPEFYNPGQIYEVIVSSSSAFDGFMMTGIYTLPDSTAKSLSLGRKNPILSSQYAQGHNMMCTIVHSNLLHHPSKALSFFWMAPVTGTGCVDFLATATLGEEVLFKDMLALQICEVGTEKKEDIQPDMKEIHSAALVLREDFESSDVFDQALWSKVSRGKLDNQCGNILHGKAASFCEDSGSRSLVTVPLNTTLATTLQFAI
ncbi:reelin-like, partial [Centruroides vittatus]|uniref:reelin-like n=1 Tax=Centruroides vittatus TaxID=120091 RepID=UPI00350FB211